MAKTGSRAVAGARRRPPKVERRRSASRSPLVPVPFEARIAILLATLALLGTGGTIVTSILTSDRQAESQAALSQRDFLRGERQAAYAAYITDMNEVSARSVDLISVLPMSDSDISGPRVRDASITFDASLEALGKSLGLVEVVGSSEATQLAAEAYKHVNSAGRRGVSFCGRERIVRDGTTIGSEREPCVGSRQLSAFIEDMEVASRYFEDFKKSVRRDLGTE